MRAVKARTVHWAESTVARWAVTGEATGGGSEQYGGHCTELRRSA